MDKELTIALNNGRLTFIYNDDLFEALKDVGTATTRRASDVEPAPGGWTADMKRVGGPKLGPFPLRSIALAEEVTYLEGVLF